MPNGYTIKDGDTLSRLAQKFGTTVSELANANNITDPEKIYVGDNLRVPQKQGMGDLGGMVKQLLSSMGGGGLPPQGMSRPQGMPPGMGMGGGRPQGMPLQGMSRPQGMGGMPPQGSHPPSMGIPPQGMPPQGMPPQGMPPGIGGLAQARPQMPPGMGVQGRQMAPQGRSAMPPMGNSGQVSPRMQQGGQGGMDINALMQMLQSLGPR